MANLSEQVNLIAFVSAFLLLVAIGIIALVLIYQKKQTQYIHEQNRLKAAFEKELLIAQLEMQEKTMKQIAQEIHDNIGGTLSLVKLNLKTVRTYQGNGMMEKIDNASELLTKAVSDLRILSKTLHQEAVLLAGIEKAIEMELKLIEKTEVFTTSFSVSGTPIAIDPQKELILFRTVQEALNNAIKHSGAGHIEIKISYHDDGLTLIIQDDGKGFNQHDEENTNEKGSGLRNIKNRTALIGAQLTISSGTSGTQIQIALPIIAV